MADIFQLLNLYQTTFFDSRFNIVRPDEAPPDKSVEKEKIQNRRHLYLIAEHGRQIVGRLFFERGEYQSNRHAGRIEIFVRREFQRRGVGQALLRHLFGWCRKHNVNRIELEAIKNNRAAVKFYQKNGFRTEGLKKRVYYLNGKTRDSLIMAKII